MLLWDTATVLKRYSHEHVPTNTKTSPDAGQTVSYFFGLQIHTNRFIYMVKQ